MSEGLVVIRGGGDLGSGAALRLSRCGFRVVILEAPQPVAVRRTVAFSEAVYEGTWQVEEALASLVASPDAALEVALSGTIPVLVDPTCHSVALLHPTALVDAIMAKRNLGTRRGLAPTVVALGPGFCAGEDVDAVVETNRGPNLGRVIWHGGAEPDTGTPGPVSGYTAERVLRAPKEGIICTRATIGDIVAAETVLAEVDGELVRAPFPGLVRGLVRSGLRVDAGMKIGDIDPRRDPALCRWVSDKALAVAGGVLEAIMSHTRRRR